MKRWRYAIGFAVAGTIVLWAHATLNYFDSSFRDGKSLVVLNGIVEAIASVLKVLTLAAIAWGVGRVFRHLQGNRGRALRGIIVWSLTSICTRGRSLLSIVLYFRSMISG
jgi:hypothetical protein